MILQYAKVHTCDFADEACLESGDTFSVCDFHGVRLGVMICYDREYPESARLLMLKGAEIIDGLCEKKTFISDDVKLRYVATLLPGVFSEGTKYACNEE